jgi:bifunctional DNA-binding transcriptional regulator/antitoxin component of YhaV-PrlF toxin-antitoxin module
VPLTEPVSFKTRLQRGNRVQLPKLVRWRYKLESDQVLKVTVSAVGAWGGFETFYARMDKSGRLTIPQLTLQLLRARIHGDTSLTGAVMEVRLEPV